LQHTFWYVSFASQSIKIMDTRQLILQKNFEAIRKQGFQGVRADKVVAELGITKGALYHYFPNKMELGYAIVDEIIAPDYLSIWKNFETTESDHVEIMIETIQSYTQWSDNESIKLGCPLNNLVQEMSPLDEIFRKKLQAIIKGIHFSIETGLKNGQLAGSFKTDFNPTQIAHFVQASVNGGWSIAKSQQNKVIFEMIINQLIQYVHILKK
jgi:TetR/AcrR family transcriptional regulator, transcriptional repressor for nem operon